MSIIADYSKVDLSSREGQRKFMGAMQYYLDSASICSRVPSASLRNQPGMKKILTKIQEFTMPSDMPLPFTGIDLAKVTSVFHQVDDLDLGWEEAFKIHDFTTTKKNNFDIIDISSGLAFEQVIPGEKAKLYTLSGARANVPILRFGGGLCWDNAWFEDDEFWNIESTTKEFRDTFFSDKAQFFYDLISASRNDSDVAFDTVGTTIAEKDANTINTAVAAIIDELKDAGLDVNPSTKFILMTPIQLIARVNNALRISLATGGVTSQINFNIKVVSTTKLKNKALSSADTTHYFVILPERKIQAAIRQNLKLLSDTDILRNGDTMVAWARHGGAIGNVGQLRRCLTA